MSLYPPPGDPALPPPMPPAVEPPAPRAWLIIGPITVQSSATLLIGLGMLVLGLAAGYLLRPLLPLPGATQPVAVNPAPAGTAAAGAASSGAAGVAEQTQAAADGAALMTALIQQTRHFKGAADAPITIIGFSDFQCGYCERFAVETLHQIDDAYIASGQVRVGYLHFAFLGDESRWAAEAAECAGDQGAFWEYHDYLFAHQSGANQGAFSKQNLKAFAADLSLDTATFNTCLENGTHSALVAGETESARQLGVRSTPTFVLNGRPIIGAQPFEIFEQYIQQALGE